MRHMAFICCMFAPLQHEAAHTRRVSQRWNRRQRGKGAGV